MNAFGIPEWLLRQKQAQAQSDVQDPNQAQAQAQALQQVNMPLQSFSEMAQDAQKALVNQAQQTAGVPQAPQQPTSQSISVYGPVDQARVADLERQAEAKRQALEEERLGQKTAGEGSLADLKNRIAQYENAKQPTDWRPLAALVDRWYGGNLAGTAQALAPQSQQERNLQSIALRNQLQQAQKGLSESQYKALQDQLQNLVGEERAAQMGLGVSAKMGSQAERTNKLLQDKFDKDPILNTFYPRIEGASKIGELITSAKNGQVVSNMQLKHQIENEIAALEVGKQAPGVQNNERMEIGDKQAQLGTMYDAITGDPKSRVSPQVIETMRKLVNELSDSYKRGIDTRFRFLESGGTPQLIGIGRAKHEALKSDYSQRLGGHWLEQQKNTSTKPKAPSDEDIKNMTPQQLKDYLGQ